MRLPKHNILLLAPIVGLVLFVGVFAGTGSGVDAPELPVDPVWFEASSDLADVGIPMHEMEASEMAAFFEEQFRDREYDTVLRRRGVGDVPSIAAPAPPRMVQPRDPETAGDRDARRGLFGGDGEPRERTGWGWLADDVQQIRGAGTPPGGTEMIEFPRRLGDADEGFSVRRWMDE